MLLCETQVSSYGFQTVLNTHPDQCIWSSFPSMAFLHRSYGFSFPLASWSAAVLFSSLLIFMPLLFMAYLFMVSFLFSFQLKLQTLILYVFNLLHLCLQQSTKLLFHLQFSCLHSYSCLFSASIHCLYASICITFSHSCLFFALLLQLLFAAPPPSFAACVILFTASPFHTWTPTTLVNTANILCQSRPQVPPFLSTVT